MIERPSTPSWNFPMKKQHRQERRAVPPMISQRTSCKVYLIDSMILAFGGVGLMFSPKLLIQKEQLETRFNQDISNLSIR